jgi:hypothetical protein
MDKEPSITKRDIMDLTKKLPQGIYDAYEKILNKSLDRERCKRLLHLVLGAKRPLFLSEMSVALAFTGQQSCDDMANKIIPENRIQGVIRDLCGLFVIVVDKRIYLLHQTAREFLVRDDFDKKKARNRHSSNPKNYDAAATIFITQTLTLLLTLLFSAVRSIFHRTWLFLTKSWKHSMDPTDSNSILAETCISYLQSDFAKESPLRELGALDFTPMVLQNTRTSSGARVKGVVCIILDETFLPRRKALRELQCRRDCLDWTADVGVTPRNLFHRGEATKIIRHIPNLISNKTSKWIQRVIYVNSS